MRLLVWYLGAVLMIAALARAWHDPGPLAYFLIAALGVWGLAGLALAGAALLRLAGRGHPGTLPLGKLTRPVGPPTPAKKEE